MVAFCTLTVVVGVRVCSSSSIFALEFFFCLVLCERVVVSWWWCHFALLLIKIKVSFV